MVLIYGEPLSNAEAARRLYIEISRSPSSYAHKYLFRILYSNELYYCTQNRTVIGHFTT
jgi:hypothetical protein